MSDVDHDDGLDKAFEGFGEDPKPNNVEPPKEEPKKEPEAPKEEPKKDEQPKPPEAPKEDPKKDEPPTPPANNEEPKKDEGTPPKAPETPPAEEPKPLTLDDVKSLISEVRTEERTSGQVIEAATKEVLEAYYPDGLSNTLVDQATGKELKTPQDVVDASGGEMSMEQATQWLMNEQYKLDQEVSKIKNDAKAIAETTLKFKQDGTTVLQKYEPVFKAYPQLQQKVWDSYKKLVKADEAKGIILSAPDMLDYYDTILEPYRLAVEHMTNQPATNPTTPPAPEPPKPGTDDRLDEGGDGGASPVDDPNDFAQQVNKELAKGI